MTTLTNFQQVVQMNVAFGNPVGDPHNINWDAVRSQSTNILDEFCELMKALGLDEQTLSRLKEVRQELTLDRFTGQVHLKGTRDALCDVNVYSYGAHHKMGIDADRDLHSVVSAVMTRFIKDEQDKQATIALHAANDVTDVYFEGEFPTMVMKSGSDQPDAPKGKFLKSASYSEPVFYTP